MKNIVLTLLILAFACKSVSAQMACGADFVMQRMMQDPHYSNSKKMLEDNILLQTTLAANNRLIDSADILTLPVVVHILHKGEAIGTGTNITDAQVIAAINDVNSRYSFLSGTGSIDTKIQFCLAKRSPSGGTTTGIDRIDASSIPNYSQYGLHLGKTVGPFGPRDTTLCKLSNWPHEDYINIWVVTKIDTLSAAFAYFPSSAGYSFQQDGLWVEYDYMLNQNSYPVVTHELGHFLNLAHTFAGSESGSCPVDTNCNVDGDKVCDTPPHKQSECSSSCAGSFPNLANSINNYMSYCGTSINRFTPGQKSRMRISLGNSNRTSLLLSGACNTPISLDVSAKTIFLNADSFLTSTCNSLFSVKNAGTQTLTSFKYYIKLYGATTPLDSFSWSGTLVPNDTISVPISFSKLQGGANKVKVYVSKPNGIVGSDLIPANDTLYEVIKKINRTKTSCTSFDSIDPLNWKQEVDKYTYYNGQYGWTGATVTDQIRTVPCQGKVMVLDNFGGSYYIDVAVKSPLLDLTKAKNPILTFKYSFKSSGKGGNDYYKCTLWTVDTCDETNLTYLNYKNISPNVAGTQSSTPWTPATCNDWQTAEFDLCSLVGSTVRLQFDVWNYQDSLSQNFYFDDVCVSERVLPAAGKDTATCASAINLNASFSSGSYWSIISGSGGQITSASNPVSAFSGQNSTDYLLAWNTPYSCNTVSDTVVVKFKKPVTPSFISPPKICLQDTLHLNAAYVPKTIAHWYHQGLFSQQGFNVKKYPLTVIDSGQYNLYFSDSLLGCKSDTVKVTVSLTDTFQSHRLSSICFGDTFKFYGQQLVSPGVYTDTVKTSNSCDTIVYLNLTVNILQVNRVLSICLGDTVNFYDEKIFSDGTYIDTVRSSSSCDTIVSLNLSVHPLPVPTIQQVGNGLKTGNFTSYQWLYNNAPVSGGSTSKILYPTTNGNYSVIVVDGFGCSDTSAVINFVNTGIQEIEPENFLEIFPNPNNGVFTIQLTHQAEELIVYDILGEKIYEQRITSLKNKIDLPQLPTGTYIVEVKSNNKRQREKLFIQ